MTDAIRSELAEVLDHTLRDLIGVELAARHLRWNVVGLGATSLRAGLEELSGIARSAGDDVAERSLTLGRSIDGFSADRAPQLPLIAAGPLRDVVVVDLIDRILEAVTTRLYAAFEITAMDPVTYDLLVRIASGLERAAWIIRALHDR